MKKKPITDVAASVHQRLLDKARQTERPFNELLQYFAIERFVKGGEKLDQRGGAKPDHFGGVL